MTANASRPPQAADARRTGEPRRRRPTGAPPPLPHHIERSGLIWLAVTIAATVAAIGIFAGGLTGWAVDVTVFDDAVTRRVGQAPIPGLTGFAHAVAQASSAPAIIFAVYALLLTLIVLRRFRHLLALLIGYYALILLTTIFQLIVHRPLPFGVLFLFRWGGSAMPSTAIETVCAVLVGVLYTLVPPGPWRHRGSWAAAVLVAVAALSRMRLGVDAPTDILLGAALGVTVPLLALRLIAPDESFPVVYGGPHGAHLDLGGARGEAIKQALRDQMGTEVSSVEPFGLAGSGGSSPMRLRQAGKDGGYLFGKLYARSHVRADRWYKLGRQLMYGRLEDERSFSGVRRLVQQEDYALRLARDAGLPSPEPHGFVMLTPEREYVLVTEFFAGSAELTGAEIDDGVIDDGLLMIRKMWDAGLAHRDIKPANLLVRDGHLLLIDVAFAEVRPTPWREAVDLGNMMLCLALRSSADRVYTSALRYFTVEEISEALAADQGLAVPGQLRQALRDSGSDVREEFLRLLPRRPAPIRVQHWSTRRVSMWAALLLAVLLLGVSISQNLINNVTPATTLNVSTVSCQAFEPLLAEAQSVPSASMLACVRSLPLGWSLGSIQAQNGRSVISLDNDRAGPGSLEITLTARCVTGRAVPVRSPRPGVRRFRAPDRGAGFEATWFDVFRGGCATIALRPGTNAAAIDRGLPGQVPLIVGYVSRATLQHELAQRSGGRLRLSQGPFA